MAVRMCKHDRMFSLSQVNMRKQTKKNIDETLTTLLNVNPKTNRAN
jgi:hypothetical protein